MACQKDISTAAGFFFASESAFAALHTPSIQCHPFYSPLHYRRGSIDLLTPSISIQVFPHYLNAIKPSSRPLQHSSGKKSDEDRRRPEDPRPLQLLGKPSWTAPLSAPTPRERVPLECVSVRFATDAVFSIFFSWTFLHSFSFPGWLLDRSQVHNLPRVSSVPWPRSLVRVVPVLLHDNSSLFLSCPLLSSAP